MSEGNPVNHLPEVTPEAVVGVELAPVEIGEVVFDASVLPSEVDLGAFMDATLPRLKPLEEFNDSDPRRSHLPNLS